MTLIADLLSTSPTIAYTGLVITLFKVDKESKSNTISFHMEDLDMTSLRLEGDIQVTKVMLDFQTMIVQLWTSKSLPPGSYLPMVIGFEAKLDPALRPGTGLYKVPCSEGSERYCCLTQGEPSGIRKAFPCVDDPDAKAAFKVSVATQSAKRVKNEKKFTGSKIGAIFCKIASRITTQNLKIGP